MSAQCKKCGCDYLPGSPCVCCERDELSVEVRRLRAQLAEKNKEPVEQRICKDCKHRIRIVPTTGSEYLDMVRGCVGANDLADCCKAEKLTDPVDGKPRYRYCAYMRSDKGKCGPEGKLFEPK